MTNSVHQVSDSVGETVPTPGPWIIDGEGNLIYAEDDKHTIVCHMPASCRNPSVMADANLIASAPAMLAALQMIQSYIRAMKHDGHEYTEAVNAAIAKATGATQ